MKTYYITLNRLPGSYTGAVAYDWRTGKISVADNGKSVPWAIHTALKWLRGGD